MRIKAALAVPGNLNGQLTKLALERLLTFAVAGIALRVGNWRVLVMPKVFGHLGMKGALDKQLGQLL